MVRSEIVASVRSDYKAVELFIDLKSAPRGNGYWKFNVSLLDDHQYVKLIEKVISNYLIENPVEQTNAHVRWDTLKCVIRGETIAYSKTKQKRLRYLQQSLEQQLNLIDCELIRCQDDQQRELIGERVILQRRLDKFVETKVRGSMIRSRAKWTEFGEKNSKYFLNLEKRHANKKAIFRLQKGSKILNDQKAILNELKLFFSTLYTKSTDNENRKRDINNFFTKITLPNLNGSQNCQDVDTHCITSAECVAAMKSMPNHKSPVSDGLPIDFYKVFWKYLSKPFLDCVRYSYSRGQFSDTQNEGIITLIPKPNRDTLQTANYRPITLLNLDYKIVAKVLSNRLKIHLKDLIHPDQNGFVKGRYIGDNIRLLFNAIDFIDINDLSGAVLSLDIYKAFDSIKWDFRIESLHCYGLDSFLIDWIKICYANPICRVTNNNWLSDAFTVGRGVRQGDPLSPPLFILAIECLAESLRCSDSYTGILLGDKRLKISLFADDALVFLDGSVSQFKIISRELAIFGSISGLVVNYTKSKAFYLGSLRGNARKPSSEKGLQWLSEDDNLKYLGITIPIKRSVDNQTALRVNFENTLAQINTVLNIWKTRGLTLIGKVTIIKYLILPKLVYKIMAVPITVSSCILKNTEKIFFKFIWGSRWERISRLRLCAPFVEGGTNMIDLNSFAHALRQKRAKCLLNMNYAAPWKEIETLFLSNNTILCLFLTNLKANHKVLNKFISCRALRATLSDFNEFRHRLIRQNKRKILRTTIYYG